MEKDMEYYIQVSGRIMKDNLDKRKSLTKKICDWYLDQDKEDICLIASGSSLNAAYAARPFLLKYSKFDISVLSMLCRQITADHTKPEGEVILLFLPHEAAFF